MCELNEPANETLQEYEPWLKYMDQDMKSDDKEELDHKDINRNLFHIF